MRTYALHDSTLNQKWVLEAEDEDDAIKQAFELCRLSWAPSREDCGTVQSIGRITLWPRDLRIVAIFDGNFQTYHLVCPR